MPLNPSVQMVFTAFSVNPAPQFPLPGQDTGITVSMTFACDNPGPNMPNEYVILLTSAEITAISTAVNKLATLQTTVIDHLQKLYRPATVISATLGNLIGQTVTV